MLPEAFLESDRYPSFHGILDARHREKGKMAYGTVASKHEDDEIARLLADAYANASVEELIRLQWDAVLDAKGDGGETTRRRWKRLFDRWANSSIYRLTDPAVSRILSLAESRNLFGLVPPLDDAIVLDVGCGYGSTLGRVASMAKHVVGVDYSLSSLVVCRKYVESQRLTNVTLVCADACEMPFYSALFTHVLSESTLEHIERWTDAVKEMLRVTSAKGIVYFRVPNRYSLMPEEHVRIWGVGFLPRAWQRESVKRLLGIDAFTETYLRSRREVRRGLRALNVTTYRFFTSRSVGDTRRSGWRALVGRIASPFGAFDGVWPSIEVVITKASA